MRSPLLKSTDHEVAQIQCYNKLTTKQKKDKKDM